MSLSVSCNLLTFTVYMDHIFDSVLVKSVNNYVPVKSIRSE